MKKRPGIRIVGLRRKVFVLVLVFLLVTLLCGATLAQFYSRRFSTVLQEASSEQQLSIEKTSTDTMYRTIEGSLSITNALQARISNDVFESVRKDVCTLQSLAEHVFRERDTIEPGEVALPDPANDGIVTAQVLFEEGVDYTASDYLPIAAHMTDTMKAMYECATYSTNVYMGFEDGTHLAIDRIASNKYDENGELISFPVRERPWYKGAVQAGELCFSGVIEDAYAGTVCVTCSAPVYVGGKLIGVVGMDIFLDELEEMIQSSASRSGFICIISDQGQIIFAPHDNGIFEVETFDTSKDMRESENEQLADFVKTALTESTGLYTVHINDEDYYMAGSPLTAVGWTVISVVDKKVVDQPTKTMVEDYDRINETAKSALHTGLSHVTYSLLIMGVLVLIIGTGTAFLVASGIVRPLVAMTEEIRTNTGEVFEMKDIYRTGDEVELLAESFADISRKTKQYIIDITRITKEKERISTELELARKIQAEMLPNTFPPFPDRDDLDIFAAMKPAKEVGGDFYDFFLIDKDHLGMVIADVSGKGVPAALFMMMTKILINELAMQGLSPRKVLEQANSIICQNNEEEMFVTVWFGILEIPTGKITAANAGHEYPIIRKADGDFEVFKDRHSFLIGSRSGMKYVEYELQLERGGTLFLYTDGVPEATDGNEEMFGMERLLDVMNRHKDAACRDLLDEVETEVRAFVGDAEQFDDLTFMGLTLLG
ncbi:MAG: SpoIIE family protein phosphatase [Oscillospiraceae bacterium]|nr:SpoIIE family protein phosphatase [Oscillospiraceae bacterium]